METRFCPTCKEEKPISEWRFVKRTCSYESYCIPCKKMYDLKYVTKKRFSQKSTKDIERKLVLFKTKLAIMEDILNERRNADTI